MVGDIALAHMPEPAIFYASLALVVIGGQCLLFGFLGEMIAAHLVRASDTYSIAEHTSPHVSSNAVPLGKASESP
jgi:hypothetical protein